MCRYLSPENSRVPFTDSVGRCGPGNRQQFTARASKATMPVRDLRSISTWLKIALICTSLGVLLFVIGFATESWMVAGSRYSWIGKGLWKEKHCSGSACRSGKYSSYLLEGNINLKARPAPPHQGTGTTMVDGRGREEWGGWGWGHVNCDGGGEGGRASRPRWWRLKG